MVEIAINPRSESSKSKLKILFWRKVLYFCSIIIIVKLFLSHRHRSSIGQYHSHKTQWIVPWQLL
jgi:hypothetical protein